MSTPDSTLPRHPDPAPRQDAEPSAPPVSARGPVRDATAGEGSSRGRKRPAGWLSRHHKQGRRWYRRLRLGFFRWRRTVLSNPHTALLYRTAVAVVGACIVVLGLILVPLPGPGWLVVLLGIAVIASEFVWARRLLRFARETLARWTKWVLWQPWWLRLAIALGTALLLAVLIYFTLRVIGVPPWIPPAWVPDWSGIPHGGRVWD